MANKVVNIVSHLYPPSVGGVERHSYNMAQELVKNGYQVNVITTNSHYKAGLHNEDGINIYALQSLFIVEGRFPIPYNPIDFIKILRTFYAKDSFTVIQTRLFLTSLIGVVLAMLSSGKVLIIEHGSGHLEYKNKLINFVFKVYEHFFTFILRLFMPDFYAVSKSGSEWLKHFNIKSKGEIYNGISTEGFNNIQIPKLLKEKEIDNKMVITYLGRLITEKGLLELIKAFKHINNPELLLAIAGSGELESEIIEEANINPNILYLGKLEHNQALGLLSKTNIFVNPSNYPEGLPTILLEAGYLALPVISTPNGGAKEVIKHLETGFQIYKGDAGEIEHAIRHMLKHYTAAQGMGQELKKEIETNYTWSGIAQRLIKLIELN